MLSSNKVEAKSQIVTWTVGRVKCLLKDGVKNHNFT